MTRDQIQKAYADANYSLAEMHADPRHAVLIQAADEWATYEHQLKWLAGNLAAEVEKATERGIATVYQTILQTSLIDDVRTAAAKIDALRKVAAHLAGGHADDQVSGLVSRFINRSPIEM